MQKSGQVWVPTPWRSNSWKMPRNPDFLRLYVRSSGVERYLESKFGDALPEVRKSMTELANAFTPDDLAQRGFGLYEQFRPNIPEGVQGWGAKGELDLEQIRKLR